MVLCWGGVILLQCGVVFWCGVIVLGCGAAVLCCGIVFCCCGVLCYGVCLIVSLRTRLSFSNSLVTSA
jgi:hypothetical protein